MLNLKLIFPFILCIFLNTQILKAQEPYIFSNDIYSGISTVGISPTQSYLNPNYWDVHLFSEDIFMQNHYGYFSKTSLLGLTKGELKEADVKNGITGENTKKVWDYYNDNTASYHFSSELMGPSASFRLKIKEKDFVIGVFSKLRSQSSIIEADNYLKYRNQAIDEPVLYNLGPFKANFMNWTEVGLNLATEIFPYSSNKWIAGLNLKYLMGHDAFYVNNKKDALMRREFIPDETDTTQLKKILHVSNFDVEVGYATGYNFESDSYEYKSQGSGIGLDIGLSMLNQDRNSEDYNFKLSMNLIDIGQIKYNGFVHAYKGENLQYTHNPNLDVPEFEDIEQFAQIVSNEIYGDPNQSLISNDFKIGLPTSFHVNASQNIGYHQYLNLNLIQRFPIFENSLKRSNILNFSYINTTHKLSYGASASLYEYRNLQFGAFLRYGPFMIGSENALPFIFPHKKLHAADFYIGFKIYPFKSHEMQRRSREDCKC